MWTDGVHEFADDKRMSSLPPLFQSELSLCSADIARVDESLLVRRSSRHEEIKRWGIQKILRPTVGGLLMLIESLRILRRVPGPVWTLSSALISMAVYSSRIGWELSTGFIVLLFVHECGHLLAARYYGIKISAPLFLPYLGAFLAVKQPLRNAFEEAVLGISGPLLGTIGSLACWGAHHFTGNLYFAELAFFGFVMNLFNLGIPLGEMDGGRVAALFSRWLYIPGFLMLGLVAWFLHTPAAILMLLLSLPLVFGLFRKKTAEERTYDHVPLGRRLLMGVLYVSLVAILAGSSAWVFAKDIEPAFHEKKCFSACSSDSGHPVAARK